MWKRSGFVLLDSALHTAFGQPINDGTIFCLFHVVHGGVGTLQASQLGKDDALFGEHRAERGGRLGVVCWDLGHPGPSGLEYCCLRAAAREGVGRKESSQETLKPQALGNKAE